MAKIKNFLKAFIPPIAISFSRTLITKKVKNDKTETWSGDYASWAEAKARCTGYDSANIFEKCKNALLKVKNGQAVYERDSVLFDEIQYSWGLLAGLQKAALENGGKLCVLDFGGSLGSTYYQNREFLSSLKSLQWCIVEQPHFVDCGKEYFENKQLKFYPTIEECLMQFKPNVLLLSSVLQYLERPYEWIGKFVSLGIENIIIDRTSFVEGDKDILTIQNVPENIYGGTYPAWFFGKFLLDYFKKKYTQVAIFDNWFTNPTILNGGKKVHWQGIIMKLRK